jgi:hypothetical protein
MHWMALTSYEQPTMPAHVPEAWLNMLHAMAPPVQACVTLQPGAEHPSWPAQSVAVPTQPTHRSLTQR